jgi:myosin heavy chain 9/10/11/14
VNHTKKNSLSQLNNRNKLLKRNLDEAEEEIQKEKTQKRKAQRDMEEAQETQDALNRELSALKTKLR